MTKVEEPDVEVVTPEPAPEPEPPIDAWMVWDTGSPPYQVTTNEEEGVDQLYRTLGNSGDGANLKLVHVTEVENIDELLAAKAEADAKAAETP